MQKVALGVKREGIRITSASLIWGKDSPIQVNYFFLKAPPGVLVPVISQPNSETLFNYRNSKKQK